MSEYGDLLNPEEFDFVQRLSPAAVPRDKVLPAKFPMINAGR